MKDWHESVVGSCSRVEELAERFDLPVDLLRRVAGAFPCRVTRYYLSQIKKKGDAIYRQCIPDPAELEDSGDLLEDPLGEEPNSLCENVVKRYPDRCLFLVSDRCAAYCRFCTRKRKFRKRIPVDKAHIDAGIACIAAHPELRDVLISGGDPFMLEDDELDYILKKVRAIPHVEIIRIGTRTPCVLPERITAGLCAVLKKYHPLFINVHFNHPDEVTPEAKQALGLLADAGIPLGCQTVLLKGVNDDPAVIAELSHKLMAARVRPYYLFQCDLVRGTAHFRTPLKTGVEIMRALRGNESGMAIPSFVIDLPNGRGKVPMLPEYLEQRRGRQCTFRTFRGERCVYPDTEEI